MKNIKIIAEIANYWQGDEELLKDTIHNAAVCQVDFLKVQLKDSGRIGNPWQDKKENIKACEIKDSLLKEIKSDCDFHGIDLIATVHHANMVELCTRTNVSNIKIASGQLHPLLVNAIKEHQWRRVFVSTGMIKDANELDILYDLVDCTYELVIMHCVSLYPTHDSELNLSRILALREKYGGIDKTRVAFGYSDHHLDDLPCFLAVSLGASYLEKHFKIKGSFGPTSEIASSPQDMGNLVGLCKRISRMFGDGRLVMQDRERESYEHYKTRYII